MTRVIQSLSTWRKQRAQMLTQTTLGFVPTMGHLHAGHASLIKRARADNERVVVSIFVNPTQFNETADFDHYPRTMDDDVALCEQLGVDTVLVPEKAALYPDGYTYQVQETEISQTLEGQCRPGHFTGMLTVVLKLLMCVKATRSYFGEKDYQQLQLIKGLKQAFFLDTEIIGCPTVRDERGLALSSRNSRLTAAQYRQVLLLPKLLQSNLSCAEIKAHLASAGFVVDYVVEQDGRRLAAATLDNIRLIDNVEVKKCCYV